jgi:hypothetical protein
MLVANVEFMQEGKIISVPSVVWLKSDNRINDLFSGPVYVSATDRSLQAVGTFAEWELNAPNRDWCYWLHEFKGQKIEGTPQVVNCIPGDAIQPQRQSVVDVDNPRTKPAALIRVFFEDETVRVELIKLSECAVKIHDVLTGPLNF